METESIITILVGLTTYIGLRHLKHKNKNEKYNLTSVLSPFGHVNFVQVDDNLCRIDCYLKNVAPGLHGLHAHEYGDLTQGCASTCKHFNPDNKQHGGALGKNRHRGDFGNILVDEYGNCNNSYFTNVNLDEIIGRGLILHENEDDLGLGLNEESKKTGNAGKRIACGVIGISHCPKCQT